MVASFNTYKNTIGVNESGTTTPSTSGTTTPKDDSSPPPSVINLEAVAGISNPFSNLDTYNHNASPSLFHWNTHPSSYQTPIREVDPRVYSFPVTKHIDVPTAIAELRAKLEEADSPDKSEEIGEFTQDEIDQALAVYMANKNNRLYFMLKEMDNPLGGIDMNLGWNRARCKHFLWWKKFEELRRMIWEAQNPDSFYSTLDANLMETTEFKSGNYDALEKLMHQDMRRNDVKREMEYRETGDGMGLCEDVIKTRESFGRFSFEKQKTPYLISPADVEGMDFGMLFVGKAYGRQSPARTPGQWWASRKQLFADFRGVQFLEEVESRAEQVGEGLSEWFVQRHEEVEERRSFNPLKRKNSEWIGSDNTLILWKPSGKRRHMQKKSEQVMSEEWRKKRRSQEKKAGRWTDGTVRMNKLWNGFHWVLDEDETPNKTAWPGVHTQAQTKAQDEKNKSIWSQSLMGFLRWWLRLGFCNFIWSTLGSCRCFEGVFLPSSKRGSIH